MSLHLLFTITALPLSHLQQKNHDYTLNNLLMTTPSTHRNPMFSSSDEDKAIVALSSSHDDEESDSFIVNKTQGTHHNTNTMQHNANHHSTA
jgi:hypothetical protein